MRTSFRLASISKALRKQSSFIGKGDTSGPWQVSATRIIRVDIVSNPGRGGK